MSWRWASDTSDTKKRKRKKSNGGRKTNREIHRLISTSTLHPGSRIPSRRSLPRALRLVVSRRANPRAGNIGGAKKGTTTGRFEGRVTHWQRSRFNRSRNHAWARLPLSLDYLSRTRQRGHVHGDPGYLGGRRIGVHRHLR